ncbi:hypothetical protein SAMN05192529_12242 [Arachidicoccus rhizosphaerae]|jgi:hypothetical protein|uniref:Uncharacterized protein n=1 Tax=Arachidicoccus rhizosphaerae TaxID=551991 RepID=A0A1H4BL03_9BACT|nr:hypothetical protein [Arachidicoccus rhizosphaerae]SEA48776.1 hypothetical protein SAMN05192529_12242 [Arachidicoccus rhizosphaerae]
MVKLSTSAFKTGNLQIAGLSFRLLFFIAVVAGGLSACSGGNEGNNTARTAKETADNHNGSLSGTHTPEPGQKDCYNFMVNNDTVIITIKWQDTTRFTGSMLYQLHEKDRNIGSLEGSRVGDLLLADYQFSSEGMQSKRQVAFKRIQDYLVEGYGPVTADSAGFIFSDPRHLNFDLNRKIQAVRCL